MTTSQKLKPKKRRVIKRSKNSRKYFTKVNEDAIIEYNNSTDLVRREELYRSLIQSPLSEMVDKIVFTYRFTTLPNIDTLREDCKIWLTTVLDKFKPEKGSKAFSYFSVITKNWFIQKVKKNKKSRQREIEFKDLSKEMEMKYTAVVMDYDETREKEEFWNHLWTEIEGWDKMKLRENEKKVLEAIKIILSSPDEIEIFNKKAIYLYIREITGLNTKQVVNCLNKMRNRYRIFKARWDRGDL
tara:strand:+ start:1301 stop:2026 length:726 start_codon:yes stop_codon:yes gene_type:complete